MNQPLPNYHSYLIRFWRMDNAGQPVWRATLQEPGGDSEVHFETPAALWVYVAAQLGVAKDEEQANAEQT